MTARRRKLLRSSEQSAQRQREREDGCRSLSPLSTFLNGRFQRELWNVAPFDAAAKSAETTTNEVVSGGIQRDLPKSEPSIIIVVVVLTRERVESILTTHLFKKQPRSFVRCRRGYSRFVRRGIQSGRRVVCSEFRRRRFLEKLSGGDFLHSSFFRRKESRQTDRQRHAGSIGGDTRAGAVAGAGAGAKKLNATKSRDKRRNPLRREEMSTAALMSDILMVSDLIETPAPLFIPSL